MELGVVRMGSEEGAIERLGFGRLPRIEGDIREITLRTGVAGSELQAGLEVGDGFVIFLVRAQNSAKLNVGSSFVGAMAYDLANVFFGLGKTPSSHIDIG